MRETKRSLPAKLNTVMPLSSRSSDSTRRACTIEVVPASTCRIHSPVGDSVTVLGRP
jgi:hypothetical protein